MQEMEERELEEGNKRVTAASTGRRHKKGGKGNDPSRLSTTNHAVAYPEAFLNSFKRIFSL